MESDLVETFQLFSKRDKKIQFDFLEYDSLSEKIRNQIFYIWKYALAIDYAKGRGRGGSGPDEFFRFMRDTLCREHGLEHLYSDRMESAAECEMYLRRGSNTEILLDLIEMSICMISPLRKKIGWENLRAYGITMQEVDAVKELNQRFRENGVGYEFTNGILIRKDSEYLHEAVTKPALYLLQEEGFEGALDEFLEAHDHFRKAEYKASITSASNAFESTMKTICAKRGWQVSGSGTSSQLIRAIVENGLVPDYLESYMASLKGISTVRNKKTGHGQGEEAIAVPEHFVNYALHLCGTNIVFLIEAYRALPEQG